MSERRPESVGWSLRRLRCAADLTQKEIADRAGLTPSRVSVLERSDDIRVAELDAYMRALGGHATINLTFPSTTFQPKEKP